MTAARPVPAGRKALLAAVHAAKRAKGLDDDTYRDMLEARTGRRSAADLTDAQLHQVLDHLNGVQGPGRKPAAGAVAAKARALWISLHALGLVSDPSERALNSWVKRQHGVDDLAWVRAAESYAVIEGLKQWATRAGVDWGYHPNPRRCVLAAQWRLLAAAGAAPAATPPDPTMARNAPALDLSAHCYAVTRCPSAALAEPAQLDRLIAELGERVRALPREAADE